jgi:hypothetical protein
MGQFVCGTFRLSNPPDRGGRGEAQAVAQLLPLDGIGSVSVEDI